MSVTIVTAPENPDIGTMPRPWVFLAGGITGCPFWQKTVTDELRADTSLTGTIFTPRRETFDPDAPKEVVAEQISWEYDYIDMCDIFTMFFSGCGSVQPICLFELGRVYGASNHSHIVLTQEPEYVRAIDVSYQTGIYMRKNIGIPNTPELTLAFSLDDHITGIRGAMVKYCE